ncbi:hypothetical protein, partial [Enterococcus faecalis]|uniref:hypothetical protein n=1 Tax=Enterococcus faecalis TaxID=1351 RepID=UPI001E3E25FF
IFSLGLLLAGCGSHDGAKPSAGAPQSFTATPRSAKSLATANHVLDLTVPASAQPQTDSEVFDDSVVFAPNFALN